MSLSYTKNAHLKHFVFGDTTGLTKVCCVHFHSHLLLLKAGNIAVRTTEKTNLLGVVLDIKLKFDDLMYRAFAAK